MSPESEREQAEMFAAYLLGAEAFTLEGTPEETIRGRLEHLAAERERTGKTVLQIIADENTADSEEAT